MLKGVLNLQFTKKTPIEYEIVESFIGRNGIEYLLLKSQSEGLFVVRRPETGEYYSQFKFSDLLVTEQAYFIFLDKINTPAEFALYKER
jgi:hypothetical protein